MMAVFIERLLSAHGMEARAAHFWYDLIALTAAWITGPEEDPPGLKVEFEF